MCGIIGAISDRNIEKILIDGLKRLEYRGYDSAGLAVISDDKKCERLRTQGKVRDLEKILNQSVLQGECGIAHTRWATHGAPSENNAHPFTSNDEIAIVHNGIIENHDALRQFLIEQDYVFHSETDSEVIVHLLHFYFKKNKDFLAAIRETITKLEGAFAIGIIAIYHPKKIFAVRHGSPLVIGKGKSTNYFASDPLALLPVTREIIYLEDGDIAEL